jgi:hypothetical protein
MVGNAFRMQAALAAPEMELPLHAAKDLVISGA